VTVGDSVWPPSAVLLGGLRNDDAASQSEDAAQSAGHRLNDSGIELVSSASSSSASDSWLAQVPFVSRQQAGASTPYKRWCKCTMEKVGGSVFAET